MVFKFYFYVTRAPQDISHILFIQGPYANSNQRKERVKAELVDNARDKWPLFFSKFYEVTMTSGLSTCFFFYMHYLKIMYDMSDFSDEMMLTLFRMFPNKSREFHKATLCFTWSPVTM